MCVSLLKKYFNHFPNHHYGMSTIKLLSHYYHIFFFCVSRKNITDILRLSIKEFDKKSRSERSRMSEERSCKETQYPLERRVIRIGGWTNRRKERTEEEREITRGWRARDRYILRARFAHNSPCTGNTDAA